MNLGELELEFRATEQDTARPYLFSPEEIAIWATQAESEAAVRGNLIRDSGEISISAGDTAVTLPSGLYDIQYVECRAADGTINEVYPKDRGTLDIDRPGWRTEVIRPQDYVHDDKRMVLAGVSDADYSLYIEFYRTPKSPLVKSSDAPEIDVIHHIRLVNWIRFRAYSKKDVDTQDDGKALEGEASFSAYFGMRKTSNLRRAQNAVKPHRNRVHL